MGRKIEDFFSGECICSVTIVTLVSIPCISKIFNYIGYPNGAGGASAGNFNIYSVVNIYDIISLNGVSVLRWFFIFAFAWLYVWSCRALISYANSERHFRKSWWDPSEDGRGNLSWRQIIELVSLEDMHDQISISNKTRCRSAMAAQKFVFLLFIIALGLLFANIIDYILFPRIPDLIFNSLPKNKDGAIAVADVMQVSQNLTGYLALIAAAISIFFTFRQLRSKVRADSRQNWINEVRTLLSMIISDIGNLLKYNYVDIRVLNERRIRLELMLNPSELDHRLLMLLIRACVIPRESICIDKLIWEMIKKEHKSKKVFDSLDKKRTLIFMICNCSVPRGRHQRNDAISHIIKLSHVILKREWERVSYIQ